MGSYNIKKENKVRAGRSCRTQVLPRGRAGTTVIRDRDVRYGTEHIRADQHTNNSRE